MDNETDFNIETQKLKLIFPDKDIKEIKFEVENAVNIYRGLRQDFELKTFNSYEKNWIVRCASELLERDLETYNLQSYSENGYSFSYYESLISLDLKREVFPKVGKLL